MARILVVEDDDNERQGIADILELEGHETLEAENGNIGLERAQAEKPDLIITGFWMPVMFGDEMVKKLLEMGNTPPIIFMVQPMHRDVGEAMVKLGVKNYIVKPYTPDELLTQVEAAIAMEG